MKYEKLDINSGSKYKWILCGLILGVLLIIIINLIFSYAKYKSVDSVKLASGTINYSEADLNIIAMYKNDGDGQGDIPVDTIPEGNYELSNESYCIVGSDKENKIQDVFEYKNRKVYIAIDKKGTKCYLYFKKKFKLTLAELLKDFTTAESGTEFSTGENGVLKVTGIDEGDNGKTLYKAEDNDGPSYFFRGQAKNNWVQFANMRWRIIRINGDGTIRMIYQCGQADCKNTTGTETILTTSSYNSEPGDNTYVGYYNFGTASENYNEAHTGTNPSTIADYLNDWYKDKLLTYDQYIDQEAGFCNDRQKVTGVKSTYDGGTGYGTSATSYAMWGRVVKNGNNRTEQLPTLKCGVSATTTTAQETSVEVDTMAYQRDLFTKTGANKGNGKLQYPIGLITGDEVLLAGGYYGTNNSSYYLYTKQYYWTMSPSYWYSGYAYVFRVNALGPLDTLGGNDVRSTFIGVRPVINLKANTTFSGGAGLVSDPFVVATN